MEMVSWYGFVFVMELNSANNSYNPGTTKARLSSRIILKLTAGKPDPLFCIQVYLNIKSIYGTANSVNGPPL